MENVTHTLVYKACGFPQSFEKNKHQIERFRRITAVKQGYKILAEMSVLFNEQMYYHLA